jgi:hypothetical protein
MLSLLLCFGIHAAGRAQSLAPTIQQSQTVIKQIEKEGNVVDAAIYDYIFKDNNGVYNYDFYFYSTDNYTIRALGDDSRNTNMTIRVLKSSNGSWQTLKQSTGTGKASAQLAFAPTTTDRYRVEVSCSLAGSYTVSCLALLIVREE